MRHTPIKHHVRTHTRSGVRVHDYERGKGKYAAEIARARARNANTQQRADNFNVTIRYIAAPAESVSVRAVGIPEAVQQAMSVRIASHVPSEVEVS